MPFLVSRTRQHVVYWCFDTHPKTRTGENAGIVIYERIAVGMRCVTEPDVAMMSIVSASLADDMDRLMKMRTADCPPLQRGRDYIHGRTRDYMRSALLVHACLQLLSFGRLKSDEYLRGIERQARCSREALNTHSPW